MKLNPVRLGLAGGIFWGASMLVMTLLAVHANYAQEFMSSLISIYPGYRVTDMGSVVGLLYGFVDGFVSLAIFGWIYNALGCCCCCNNDDESKCEIKK